MRQKGCHSFLIQMISYLAPKWYCWVGLWKKDIQFQTQRTHTRGGMENFLK